MRKQYLKQTFIYVFEVSIVVSFFVWVSSFLSSFASNYDVVERAFMFFAAYQGLVALLNKNQLDARKDAYLAVINAFEYAELSLEVKDEFIKEALTASISNINPQKVFFTGDTFDLLQQLNTFMQSTEVDEVKLRNWVKVSLISLKHAMATEELGWNKTFLVKLLK